MPLTRSTGGIILAVFLLVASATMSTMAFPTGPPANAAKDGCTCHGGPSSETVLNLAGVPSQYRAGARYPLSIVSQSPVVQVEPPANFGGFQIMVTHGAFVNASSFNATWIDFSSDGKTAQHTETGDRSNYQHRWDIAWDAPSPARESVTFYLAINRVNGDGTAEGDMWNQMSITSSPAPDENGAPGLGGIAVLAVAVGVAVLAFSARRSQP